MVDDDDAAGRDAKMRALEDFYGTEISDWQADRMLMRDARDSVIRSAN